ncbi:hypothetical protein N7492_007216 [Penicillium capsulatum]|uniref:Uncharacterized protein n=1 Tax=Penicillium capsulatum TaxID=69766 RepID=A0A9W9LLG9_9EURO|nr:hypothetical protein N7492_007216 [Penicillium capsulatum]KAJ6117054.1 hypothetical protein N7512_006779 [Penicillium capsulatum]
MPGDGGGGVNGNNNNDNDDDDDDAYETSSTDSTSTETSTSSSTESTSTQTTTKVKNCHTRALPTPLPEAINNPNSPASGPDSHETVDSDTVPRKTNDPSSDSDNSGPVPVPSPDKTSSTTSSTTSTTEPATTTTQEADHTISTKEEPITSTAGNKVLVWPSQAIKVEDGVTKTELPKTTFDNNDSASCRIIEGFEYSAAGKQFADKKKDNNGKMID